MHFQGEFNNSIDAKGRASIPAKFRDTLRSVFGDERLMVTKRQGGLVAYPLPEWQQTIEQVDALPLDNPARDHIYRTLIAPARECGFDKSGRIQISPDQRAYAGLEKEIVVVGMAKKIEIWSQVKHAEVTKASESFLEDQASLVAGLGF